MIGETPPAAKGVTEAMVNAACKAQWQAERNDKNQHDAMRAALLAALSLPVPGEGEQRLQERLSAWELQAQVEAKMRMKAEEALAAPLTELWALCYLHDWDPPKEGQEHRWEPGKNVFPEIHAFYRTWQEAEAVKRDMGSASKYWVVRAQPESEARLAKALSTPAAPELGAVKALNWRENPLGNFVAESIVGQYFVFKEDNVWNWVVVEISAWRNFPSPEAAKAAAQQDFETRILSALVRP